MLRLCAQGVSQYRRFVAAALTLCGIGILMMSESSLLGQQPLTRFTPQSVSLLERDNSSSPERLRSLHPSEHTLEPLTTEPPKPPLAFNDGTQSPRLYVAIISGGSNETIINKTKYKNVNLNAGSLRYDNRKAVLETWGQNEQVWFVTREPVETNLVITLDPKFEEGGRDGLPDKVRAMWEHIFQKEVNNFDFFMKADDDTYIHVPRLKRLLSLLDPDIPMHIGRKVGGNEGFCHGGSGYIISRSLLAHVGPELPNCFSGRSRDWEDLWMRNCVARSTSLGKSAVWSSCMDFENIGFDAHFSNSKNQSENSAKVETLYRSSPGQLALQVTFHSAYADLMRQMHATFHDVDAQETFVNLADNETRLFVFKNLEVFTSGWRGAVTYNAPGRTSISTPVIHQQSALRRPLSGFYRNDNLWRQLVQNAGFEQDSLDHIKGAFRSGVLPAQSEAPLSWVKTVDFTGGRDKTRGAMPPYQTKTEFAVAQHSKNGMPSYDAEARGPRHAVVVIVRDSPSIKKFGDNTPPPSNQHPMLQILVKSLRGAGSGAHVLLLARRPEDFEEATQWPGVFFAGVLADSRIPEPMNRAAGLETVPYLARFFEELSSRKDPYESVLVTTLDTVFQINPFEALDLGQSLGVFLSRTCSTRVYPQIYEWFTDAVGAPQDLLTGPKTGPDTCGMAFKQRYTSVLEDLFIGPPASHAVLYQAILDTAADFNCSRFSNFKIQTRCDLHMVLNSVIWDRKLAVRINVTLFDSWHSPLASHNLVRDDDFVYYDADEEHASGSLLVANGQGAPVSLFQGYSSTLQVSSDGGYLVPTPHTRLAPVGGESPPTFIFNLWAEDRDPAALLLANISSVRPNCSHDIVPALQSTLLEFDALSAQSQAPPAKEVAIIRQRNAESTILAGILFRYAARRNLRIFAPAESRTEALQEDFAQDIAKMAQWRQAVDVSIHQVPKLVGGFDAVREMYETLISPHVRTITIFNEPLRQYCHSARRRVPLPSPKKAVEVLLRNKLVVNPMAAEFGISTEKDLEDFVSRHLSGIDVVLLADRWEESIVLMRRLLGWSVADMIFLPLSLEENVPKHLHDQPDPHRRLPVEEYGLSEVAMQTLVSRTYLDRKLFEAATARFEELLGQFSSPDFDQEVSRFRTLQSTFTTTCSASCAQTHPVCVWYHAGNNDPFSLISQCGYAKPLPGDIVPPQPQEPGIEEK